MLCWILLAGSALAEWRNLHAGMSTTDVLARLGYPLFVTRGNGYEMWSYDNGGSAILYHGVLQFFTVPKNEIVAPQERLERSHSRLTVARSAN